MAETGSTINPAPVFTLTSPSMEPLAPLMVPTTTVPTNPRVASPNLLLGVDAITLATALACGALTCGVRYKRGVAPIITRRKLTNDFLNGSVIYPFLLLVASVGSNSIFDYIENAKLAVGLAGVVGIIFVIGELLLSCAPEDEAKPPS